MLHRDQIIEKLRGIEPQFSEIAFGFGRDGQPTVESGGPSVREGLLTRAEIEQAIQFLQAYLDICPDDTTVAHSNLHWCGNDSCEECYARQRSHARHYFFASDEMNAQQQWSGFVCLVKVGEQFDFCASGDPRKKVRELTNSYSEPVKLVHSIKSNHQMLSKLWWLRACVDYVAPKSRYLQLSQEAIQLFKSQPEHLIETKDDHKRIMGSVEEALHIPANLPCLLRLPVCYDARHDEAIWEALQQGKSLP